MTGLFTRALKMAMVSGWIVLPVCLLRHVLHRCPKKYTVCLWALVAVRLVCPVTVRSSLSLIPQRLELAASKLATLPLGAIWLAGMGTMLQLGFFRLLRLTRRLKEAVLWKDNVWVCDYLPTPFVLGVFRPKIYLPSCLKPEDAQLVLAHEREHIRRLDPMWKILAYGLLCVYWFHPLLWLAYWLFGLDVELACDQATAAKLNSKKRQKYAELIITWAAPCCAGSWLWQSRPEKENSHRSGIPEGLPMVAAGVFGDNRPGCRLLPHQPHVRYGCPCAGGRGAVLFSAGYRGNAPVAAAPRAGAISIIYRPLRRGSCPEADTAQGSPRRRGFFSPSSYEKAANVSFYRRIIFLDKRHFRA